METTGLTSLLNSTSLEGLTELGVRGRVDMRPTLLRVLTDLYVQKLAHTPDEERHYTELALRLLDSVDVSTRVIVATRLARHLSPPIRIINRLARDLPDVAAALQSHPLLQPPTRAAEATASPSVVPDIEAAVLEPINKGSRFATSSRRIDAATAHELNELFFAATASERRLILLNLDVVVPAAAERSVVPHDPALIKRLETTALARNSEGFAQHVAALLQVSQAQARRVVRDDLGEPIVVAAKAAGVARDVLYRILMFANPVVGHSVERVHALAELYDDMTSRAADDLVAIWQALPQAERAAPKHQPLFWNDETRARARPAANAQRTPIAPRFNVHRDVG